MGTWLALTWAARQIAQREIAAQQLAALNRISQTIASSLELEDVFEAFFQEVAGLVPLDRSSIVFFDEDFETFEVAADFTLGESVLMGGRRLPVANSGLKPVVTQPRPSLRPDLLEEPPFNERDLLIADGVRCALAVPLIVKGKLIGAVNFASRQPGAYSEADIELLTGIAEQMAVAVENSRLYAAAADDELPNALMLSIMK